MYTQISVNYIINRRYVVVELQSARLPECWHLPQKSKNITEARMIMRDFNYLLQWDYGSLQSRSMNFPSCDGKGTDKRLLDFFNGKIHILKRKWKVGITNFTLGWRLYVISWYRPGVLE